MSFYIDVFNGDADGICALIQLRLADPQQSQLITGIKRDINLLKQVQAQGCEHITVLDISFKKNVNDVERLLKQGCKIDYIDHHNTGTLIESPRLFCNIDLSADTCTSLIVDQQLNGRYHAWALVAAFGDNLANKAYSLGMRAGYSQSELNSLQQLGICLNYNAYGESLDDLFYHPAELYKKLQYFESPFDFIKQDTDILPTLSAGYQHDMDLARQIKANSVTPHSNVIILPNEKWARRVGGVLGNELANQSEDRAHAILTEQLNGNYKVSLRSPLNRPIAADLFASQFPSGGGRFSAAGINMLPKEQLPHFIIRFNDYFKPTERVN